MFGDWDIGDLFGGGGGGDALPLPPDFVSYEDAMAGAADSGGGGGGFWDSAGNWIANNAGGLIRGVTALGGAYLGSNANSAAAGRAADATAQAAAINAQAAAEARAAMEAAKGRGISAIRAGTQAFADTIAPNLQERPVQLPVYRGLTAAQDIAREDMLRRGRTTLATSGLRGAGRAGVAALMDQDRRFMADATARNDADRLTEARRARGSADSARTSLAQVRAQEGSAIANTEIGQSNRIADNITRAGETQAGAVNTAGQIQAGGDLANAGVWTDALGTIGSIVAGATKESNRDRYSTSGDWI